jgi:ABC-type nitrate/sulfonate/bicarbonate transport system substrate-binding protein
MLRIAFPRHQNKSLREMTMQAFKKRTTLLLNWYANPYHTPIFVAKALGYYSDVDILLAILETTDPSDVTEIVGLGTVDIGLKAMIHTIAARSKGFPVTSIGTLLDEPPTGLISLKSAGINKFQDIIGKRVGYIGEFGKLMVQDLAKLAHIPLDSFETIRVGMNVTDAIGRGIIDTGIGFINFQQVELQELCGETTMLRLDQLAGLGCCCFCSIQFIVHQNILNTQSELLSNFMLATHRGAAFTTENPDDAFELLCQAMPRLRTPLYRKIFNRTLPFYSRTLLNVDRDWNKVGRYTKHLGIIPADFQIEDLYTNDHVPQSPYCEIQPIACCAR